MQSIIIFLLLLKLLSATKWVEFNNFQYLINIESKVAWETANKACEKEDAKLLIIESPEEANWIMKNYSKNYLWLALRQDNKDKKAFSWTNNTTLNSKIISWDPQELSKEECGITSRGVLLTAKCNSSYGYVCKRKYKASIKIREVENQQCENCQIENSFQNGVRPKIQWRLMHSRVELNCYLPQDIIIFCRDRTVSKFNVQWFANGGKIFESIVALKDFPAVLVENFLADHLQKTISCQIKAFCIDNQMSKGISSFGFFAGIKILNPNVLLKLAPNQIGKISFQMTLPVICPAGIINCALKTYLALSFDGPPTTCANRQIVNVAVIKCPSKDIASSFCGLTITNQNWNAVHTIEVTATIHSQFVSTKQATLKIFTMDKDFTLWGTCEVNLNIQISIVNVHIVNNVCKSYNDPHMTTFDGKYYEHHIQGTFVLYRNRKTKFEVQAFYKVCSPGAKVTCNCAVAVKSNDLVVVIDRCGRHGNMEPTSYMIPEAARHTVIPIGNFNNKWKGTSIYRLNGGKIIEIVFPTGTYVIVHQSYHSFINLEIRASAFDLGNTEGLCGTFNGNQHDDFTCRNGHVCGPQFNANWLVSWGQGGLFTRHYDKQTFFQENIFCICNFNDVQQQKKTCGYNNNIIFCRPAHNGVDITHHLIKRSILQKRSTYHDFPEDNHLDKDWALRYINNRKTREAEKKNVFIPKSKDEARKYCIDAMKKSSAGHYCRIVPNVKFGHKIDFCVLDIMATNTTNFVESAIESVKEDCITEINRNTSLWVARKDKRTGKTIYIPPPKIANHLCANDCSNQGICIKGMCKCNKGFVSYDCSIKKGQAPHVYYIPHGGLCNKNRRPCRSTIVYGMNFIESNVLSCYFEEVVLQLNNAGYYSKQKTSIRTRAIFESFGEVICKVPTIRRGLNNAWLVRVSNDRKAISEDATLFVIYDSKCISCGKEGTCEQKKDTCIIKEKCYIAKENNPATTCEKCDPHKNKTSWTPDPKCSSEQPIQPTTPKLPIIKVKPSESSFKCLFKTYVYPHPKFCNQFIICKNWSPLGMSCKVGKVFNPKLRHCDAPKNVPDCKDNVWTKTQDRKG